MDILANTAAELGRVAAGAELDVARLEGVGICFLCSTDPEVRRCTWDLLSSLRRLHFALNAPLLDGKPIHPILLAWSADV